jgi:formylglycine-generating enzyme required for sulfatase activity
MMKNFYWILFIMIVLSCKTQPDAVRKLTDSKHVNPPGTFWLKDSLYIDQAEISNLNYLEYVVWVMKNEPQNYIACLPDTLVWREREVYNEPYPEYYFRHPYYRNFPVVGVSYEQAVAFCKWRTARVKGFIVEYNKSFDLRPRHHKVFQNFEYRLPTKEEWEYAAFAGLDSNRVYGFKSIIAKNNLPKIWVKETRNLYGEVNEWNFFCEVISHEPNKYGCYHMIGNLAEMISEKGISKGGSAFNSLNECEISKSIPYTQPSYWLGFRCICEIH